jgi:hypothetical protein
MKLHKVILKEQDANGSNEVFGYISKVVAEKGVFYLLGKDDVGMIGQDGREFRFDQCAGVYHQTRQGFKSGEQIEAWLDHARRNRLI